MIAAREQPRDRGGDSVNACRHVQNAQHEGKYTRGDRFRAKEKPNAAQDERGDDSLNRKQELEEFPHQRARRRQPRSGGFGFVTMRSAAGGWSGVSSRFLGSVSWRGAV
jgi:hypothetical protein